MTDLGAAMDPRVILAMTLISLGVATVEKLRAVWAAHGVDESSLDAILAEVQTRLDRRADPPPVV